MSNNPPKSAEEFQPDIEDLEAEVAKWSGQEVTADNVEVLHGIITTANDVKKEAEAARVALKEPYLQGGKKVDASFKPVTTAATDAVKSLKGFLSVYLIAEKKKQDEAARIAREEAERKAAEAAALQDDKFVGEDAIEDAKQADIIASRVERNADVAGQVSSGAGRTIGLRTSWEPVVNDAAAMVAHYANHPDVQAAALKVANAQIRSMKGAVVIPGVEVKEVQKAA